MMEKVSKGLSSMCEVRITTQSSIIKKDQITKMWWQIFGNFKSCRSIRMIEKLSAIPTTKCNLLDSSIFNNTRYEFEPLRTKLLPFNLHSLFWLLLSPSRYVCVIITATWGGWRVPFKLNVLGFFSSNWKLSISHPCNSPPTLFQPHMGTLV